MVNKSELYPITPIVEGINPKSCERCDPSQQIFYWRSFTEESLATFAKNNYLSPIVDFSRYAVQDEDTLIIDKKILDTPGNLWTSPNPSTSIPMGITRGVLENKDIFLLGVNYCPDARAQGVEGYKAISVGEKIKLFPLQHTKEDFLGITGGTVFNFFTPEQIKNGVLYQIDPNFIGNIRQLYESKYKQEIDMYGLNNNIWRVFTQMLYELGINRQYGNNLLEIYHPFLTQLYNGPKESNKNEGNKFVHDQSYIDILTQQISDNFQEKRTTSSIV